MHLEASLSDFNATMCVYTFNVKIALRTQISDYNNTRLNKQMENLAMTYMEE